MKRQHVPLAVFLAVVFALKLIVVLQLKDHILLQPETTDDTGAYVGLAAKVVAGDWGLGPGLYYVSPLYIYFLALTYGPTGSLAAVRVLQVLLGTASIAMLFVTARMWFTERAAWIAAGIAALTGLLTFYEAVILQAALDPVLTSTALLFLTRGLLRGDLRGFAVAGALFGLQSLNRPNILVAAAAIILLLAVMRRWRWSVVLAAGFLAALLPVAARNLVVSNQATLVSSHGGLNFLIGNGEGASGFYRQIPGVMPTIDGQARDTRRVAELARGRSMSDAEVSAYFSDQAWDWIRANPPAWAGLVARKLFYTFNAQHIPLPLSYPFYAFDANTLLQFLFVGPWLLFPLGLVGLGLHIRSRPSVYLVWCAFVPAYALSVALFFVSERYRLPLFVPLAIGAGAALDAILTFAQARRVQALITTAAAIAVVSVAVNWPLDLADGDKRGEERVHMAENLAHRKNVAAAEHWAALALPVYHSPWLLHYRVGAQFFNVQLWQPAIEHLSQAEALNPKASEVQLTLGRALIRSGRPAEGLPRLRRAVDAKVRDNSAVHELAAALRDNGDVPAAVALLRTTTFESDDVEAWLRLGRLAMELRAPDAAEPFFRRATVMAPGQASAHQQLGLNLLVQRRFPDARASLAEAVRLDAQNADSLANLAYADLQLGAIDSARSLVAAALQLEPAHPLAVQLRDAIGRIKVRL